MIEIIPAIDLIGGECVRLSQGDYDRKTTYASDPLPIAQAYEQVGIRRLHLVDLDGAKASFPANLEVLRRIASATKLDIQYGGGIKSAEALRAVFEAGARRAICGSIAVAQPELFRGWLREFGPQRIILGADVKDGFVATHGWLETSAATINDLIDSFLTDELSQVICTDISKDGMLCGPNFELYRKLQKQYPSVDVTVSGGISEVEDIRQLDAAGMHSVIVGKALYENRITLDEIQRMIR